MKRLFVLSDSHGVVGRIEDAADYIRENRFDMVIHLGDIRKDAERLSQILDRDITGVAGNCDYFSHDSREEVITVEDVRILAVHGDKYGVKSGYDRLSYYAEERACQLALFGHTHVPFYGQVGKALLLNPGTLINGGAAVVEIDGSNIRAELIRL